MADEHMDEDDMFEDDDYDDPVWLIFGWSLILGFLVVSYRGSTLVEHYDSNPAAGIKRRKNEIKCLLCRKKTEKC